MANGWKGYTPGSPEALMAAATYQPGVMVQEAGYPEPESVSGLVPSPTEMVGMAMAIIAGQEEGERPTPTPVVYPAPAPRPVVTNGVVTTLPPVAPSPVAMNGEYIMGAEEEVYGAVAVPTAFPLVAGIAGIMSLGVFKALLARFGPILVKMLVGAAAFTGFMKLLGLGASDDTQLPIKPGEKKRRRYSIGANPRVRTLQKVSRHCMRMLKRHRKVIDEFLPPKRQALPAKALARTYLSTAERKALSA